LDPLAVLLNATVQTLGVDPEQDLYGLARPLGDVGRRDASVEPGRHGGVPKVVRPLGQGRGDDLRRERRLPRTAPDPDRGGFG